VRGFGYLRTIRLQPLTPPLSQPKSDISDFGRLKMPNSGKPEFGWEREQTERAARPVINQLSPASIALAVAGPIGEASGPIPKFATTRSTYDANFGI